MSPIEGEREQVTIPASLILTVLNEAASLPSFLESVARLDHVPAEIVVVDGGSVDGTVQVLEQWAPPAGVIVRVIVRPGAGIAEGRNAAISEASSEYLLITDGGTQLSERWATQLFEALRSGHDVASGFFEAASTSRMGTMIASIITPKVGEIDPETFLPSSRSLGLTKSAWEKVGGYPEWLDYCEDLVLDLALRDAGARFTFVPEAVASWDARPSVRAFARQYYRYARGDGKAGLWPKRHAARYAAYATGTLLVAAGLRKPLLLVPLLLGFSGYAAKFLGRVVASHPQLGHDFGNALILTPVIVVVGDVSKMLGYPVGVAWRMAHRSDIARGKPRLGR